MREATERGYFAGRAVIARGGQVERAGQRCVSTRFEAVESTPHEVALRKLLLIAPCWPNQARYIPEASWWLSLPRELAAAWEPVAQARALAMKSDHAAARWMRVAGLLESASRDRVAVERPKDGFARDVEMVAATRGVNLRHTRV